MRNQLFIVPFYFLFAGLLSSCAPMLYTPNELNMPLARDAKILKTGLYFGIGGFSGEASYTIDSNFLLLANGLTAIGQNQYSFDGGAGYYHAIEDNLNLEVLLEYGYGRADADSKYDILFGEGNATEEDILHGSYTRACFQMDISRTNWKGGIIGFGIRVGSTFPRGFYYREILSTSKPGTPNQNSTTPPPPATLILDDNTYHSTTYAILVEPGISFNKKVGKHSFFHTSIGFSLGSGQNMTYGPISNTIYWPVMAALGYTFVF